MGDHHLHERGALFEIEHPTEGAITVCRSPLHFSKARQADYRPSPGCGADTDYVLGDLLGIDSDARAALAEAR